MCQWDLESCQRQSISLIVETSSGEISCERKTHGSLLEKMKVAAGREHHKLQYAQADVLILILIHVRT